MLSADDVSAERMLSFVNTMPDHVFEYTPGDYILDFDVHWPAFPEVIVFSTTREVFGSQIEVFGHGRVLADYVRGMEEKVAPPAAKKARTDRPGSASAKLSMVDYKRMYPWIKKLGDAAPELELEAAGDEEASVAAELDDDIKKIVADALAGERAMLAEAVPVVKMYFKTTIRGGEDLMLRKGKAVDYVRAYALTAAKEWCRDFQMAQTKDFNVDEDKLPGILPYTMADYWCEVNQFFFSLWLDAGSPDFDYTAEHLAAAPQGELVQVELDPLPANHFARRKMAEINGQLRPRRKAAA